jgi:hypothetical protein
MARLTHRVLVVSFVLFGLGLAGFAALFGELTCETGCFGPGPSWTQDPDAPQWDVYWMLGVGLAICVVVSASAAWLRRAAWALIGLVGATSTGLALWWRVDLASPNSAGDLWIWLLLGLPLGASAIGTGLLTRSR